MNTQDAEKAEKLARRFHDLYESLSERFGYTTREETRAFDPETPNGRLMIAVCNEIASADLTAPHASEPQPRDYEREAREIELDGCNCGPGYICNNHFLVKFSLRQAHRAGAREAAEKACRAVCEFCRQPEKYEAAEFVDHGDHWLHRRIENGSTAWCKAANIRAARPVFVHAST